MASWQGEKKKLLAVLLVRQLVGFVVLSLLKNKDSNIKE
jgi:hypothetical protein